MPKCISCGKQIFESSSNYRKRLDAFRLEINNPDAHVCGTCMSGYYKSTIEYIVGKRINAGILGNIGRKY